MVKSQENFEIAIALQEFNKYHADIAPKGRRPRCRFVSMRFWLL
ncbi:hypothetical protein [Nostoc sp. KVJ20]|nr:hypothetical protein [Nostoc sp. KVJ20]